MEHTLKPISEQVIVIDGASSGIGLATARLAADRGAKLVLASRSDDTMNDIVEEMNSSGVDAIVVTCDIANREDVTQVAAAAMTHFWSD